MRVDINELLLHGDIPTILVVTLESISWHIAKLMHIDKTNLPPPLPVQWRKQRRNKVLGNYHDTISTLSWGSGG